MFYVFLSYSHLILLNYRNTCKYCWQRGWTISWTAGWGFVPNCRNCGKHIRHHQHFWVCQGSEGRSGNCCQRVSCTYGDQSWNGGQHYAGRSYTSSCINHHFLRLLHDSHAYWFVLYSVTKLQIESVKEITVRRTLDMACRKEFWNSIETKKDIETILFNFWKSIE